MARCSLAWILDYDGNGFRNSVIKRWAVLASSEVHARIHGNMSGAAPGEKKKSSLKRWEIFA